MPSKKFLLYFILFFQAFLLVHSFTIPHLAQIKTLDVKCGQDELIVDLEFDRPFNGLIYSNQYYYDPHCFYVFANSNQTNYKFGIRYETCGMTVKRINSTVILNENTIIIQHDKSKNIGDYAKTLSCEKSVSEKEGLSLRNNITNIETQYFYGDQPKTWMKLLQGHGPNSPELINSVQLGDYMTLVLGLEKTDNEFDLNVKDCVATDGDGKKLKLVDSNGCILKPAILSPFKKIRNFKNSTIVYSVAKTFRFPDASQVNFECSIHICDKLCPPATCSSDEVQSSKFLKRVTRSATSNLVSHSKMVEVMETSQLQIANDITSLDNSHICVSLLTIIITGVTVAVIFAIMCGISIFIYVKGSQKLKHVKEHKRLYERS